MNQNQIATKDPIYIDLGKTIAFIEDQRDSLEKIKQKFPDLSPAAQAASLGFKSAFGRAEEAITSDLQSMRKQHYLKDISDLRSQATSLDFQNITHEGAQIFIEEVEARAKGNIPSPFLETLLTYEYRNNPSEEFSRNFIREYNTKGHPKAKGLELTVSYPISWRPAEGELPDTVQKFTSENGRGLELFSVIVKDLPFSEGYIISEQELDEIFTESRLKGMLLPPGAKFISAKPVILDNHKAGVISFDETMQSLDTTVRTQVYMTTVKGKGVFLRFSAAILGASENALQAKFQKFEPLFKMIANSFII